MREQDIKDVADATLWLGWRRLMAFYVEDGREVEVIPPQVVPAGPLSIRAEEMANGFRLRAHVTVTVPGVNQVMFTCLQFVNEIVAKLPAIPDERPADRQG